MYMLIKYESAANIFIANANLGIFLNVTLVLNMNVGSFLGKWLKSTANLKLLS